MKKNILITLMFGILILGAADAICMDTLELNNLSKMYCDKTDPNKKTKSEKTFNKYSSSEEEALVDEQLKKLIPEYLGEKEVKNIENMGEVTLTKNLVSMLSKHLSEKKTENITDMNEKALKKNMKEIASKYLGKEETENLANKMKIGKLWTEYEKENSDEKKIEKVEEILAKNKKRDSFYKITLFSSKKRKKIFPKPE